mmetsp:Transcript_24164/g.69918  ORF Transcript_24164/g.69918 Transcript_24164/m.69918 type:complete len:215 (+) Transcript_24164:522-1166(+)
MHSLSACKDALISAPSCCRSLEWNMESFFRSVPAQSTSMSCPSVCIRRKMHTEWLRELTEFASVAEVARRDCAMSMILQSSSGVPGYMSTAPSAAKEPSLCSRRRSSGRRFDRRPSETPGARRSKQRLPLSSTTCMEIHGMTPSMSLNRSCAPYCWIADIVWVLPLPVCPNMNMVPTPPSRALRMRLAAVSWYTVELSTVSSKTRSKSKVMWLT